VCVVWDERGNTGVNMLLLQCDLLGGHESLFLFFLKDTSYRFKSRLIGCVIHLLIFQDVIYKDE